ncbi:kelch motif family protein [Stylonychia lemnae]|uniref:Kelch motif family protein n=1 Tax=Stylonychia lemnae TaxID=5949 RepID=A0A078A9H2_STYLE|nr:kelch motif family protein [Stylonychia lemnae]|eukprot:CDW78242.1 kelch motif family protein [Stylonychia lemnae]
MTDNSSILVPSIDPISIVTNSNQQQYSFAQNSRQNTQRPQISLLPSLHKKANQSFDINVISGGYNSRFERASINSHSNDRNHMQSKKQSMEPTRNVGAFGMGYDRSAMYYCPQKEYESSDQAREVLEQSKVKISQLLSKARNEQFEQFKSMIKEVIEQDHNISLMPTIRVKSKPKQVKKLTALKNVPISFRNKADDDQRQQSSTKDTMSNKILSTMFLKQAGMMGMDQFSINKSFDAASARHRFKKENTLIRTLYNTMCKTDQVNKWGQSNSPKRGSSLENDTQQSTFNESKMQNYNNKDHSLTKMNQSKISNNASMMVDDQLRNFITLQDKLMLLDRTRPKIKIIKNEDSQRSHQFQGGLLKDNHMIMPATTTNATINKLQLGMPKNKLMMQMQQGIQQLVQKVKKRESYLIECFRVEDPYWNPPPRESGCLVQSNHKSYLIGGLNYETSKDVPQLRIVGDHVQWLKSDYESQEKLEGRLQHTAVAFKDKILIFGGCYMYNKKRQQRDCINQVVIYDPQEKTMSVLKTSGISIQPRRRKNMIVYGGYLDNGSITDELLSLDLDDFTWQRVQPQKSIEGLAQSASVSVILKKPKQQIEDYNDSKDGIYVFGGLNKKGELLNKLRLFRFQTSDGIVKFAEWTTIKSKGGKTPCPRIGHTMNYLSVTQALIVIGGRNDELSKNEQSPFLNDIYLFLFDQMAWTELKYTGNSHRLEKICNHASTVETNYDNYEKVLIFGGVQSKMMHKGLTNNQFSISNQLYLMEIKFKP